MSDQQQSMICQSCIAQSHRVRWYSSSLQPHPAACHLGSNHGWKERSLAQWCSHSQQAGWVVDDPNPYHSLGRQWLTLCSMWMFSECCSYHTRCCALSQGRMGLHSLRVDHSCTGSTWYCLLMMIMMMIMMRMIKDDHKNSPNLTKKRKQMIVDKNFFMVSCWWYCWILSVKMY